MNLKENKTTKYTTMCFMMLLMVSATCNTSFAVSIDNSVKAFNLATVVDNFLNIEEDTKIPYTNLDEKSRQKKEFIETTKRFNQGNVSVAYNDYAKLISELDNDIALFVCAKSMYEIGFFSLGDLALSKITSQNFFVKQIDNLKKSYKNSYTIDKTEEIYLAKAYSSIYFDNSPEEVAFDLNKKTGLIEKSDYANFILAQALYESRQYQQALMFIDTALRKNPGNPNYISYKVKILTGAKKYKDALKLVEKTENTSVITPEYKNKLAVQKENILSYLSDNENDKKFHTINAIYLEGDYYKVISECQNTLNFNKNNYKLLTLQAKSYIYAGNIEQAEKNLNASYDLNKKYEATVAALGDICYIKKDYKKALGFYKKAQSLNKNDTVTLAKIALIYKNNLTEGNEKNLIKLENKIKKTLKDPYLEYYYIASTVLPKDSKLKREYLLKSMAINLLYENSWREFLQYQTDKQRILPAKNFIYMISFTNTFSYFYYYYNALVEIAENKNDLALADLKYSISLNPYFEPAGKKITELNQSQSI